MIRTAKIAISLPKDDVMRIEKIRKKLGIQRSAVIDMAIRFWLNDIEERKLIRQYEEGYRRRPESLSEIKAFETMAADAFEEEGLK